MNDKQKIEPGARVRIIVKGDNCQYYCYGEVTLIGSLGIKVLLGDPLYSYDYWKEEDLELVSDGDTT